MKRLFTYLVIVLFLSLCSEAFAQPLPCPPINSTSITGIGDTTICNGGCTVISCIDTTSVKSTTSYQYSTIPYLPTTFTGGTTILVGIDDIYSGIVPLPFPFCFYGTKYNSCIIGANGEICFNTALAGGSCPWSISGPIPTPGELNAATLNTIMGVYEDIDPGWGGIINWAIYGTAPCRTFVVSWSNVPFFNTGGGLCVPDTNTQQIVLYESTYAIDIFVKHKPFCTAWNGGLGILGICDATGANYNIAPGYNATVFAIDDSGYRFTPNGPASWTYTWTDHSGTVVATTQSATVCPTDSMTYTVKGVASSNCDSYLVYSSVFVNVGNNPTVSHYTFANPNICGANNGQIKLIGLIPGISDTIYYKYNGGLQPYLAEVSAGDSSLTLTGLCAGVYDSIVVKVGACHTPPYGPITLSTPPLLIGTATTVNPSVCGACDGSFTVNGLMPNQAYILNYTKDGVAQPPLAITTTTAGTITIGTLCAGVYDNINFTINSVCTGITCVTPTIGPYTLTQPSIFTSFTQTIHYGCYGDSVFYQNFSTTVGPLYYIWHFGDGITDTATNPKHVFAQGIYTVTLVATNLHCVDSFKMTDSLIHPLVAAFTDSPNIVCQGSPVTFTNNTAILSTPPLSYIWNFRDGGTSNATNPVYIFKNSGTYNVQLIASNFIPCYDTAYETVYIDSSSPITIKLTDSVFCRSTYVTFTGIYTTIGNTGVTWNFGDGDSVLNMNPVSHSYDRFGTDTVTITAYYRACKDTSTYKVISVFPEPVLNLGSDTTICKGSESITLTDNNNAKTQGAKWKWNTGQTTPSIVVTAPGYYSVIVSINGCEASDTIWVKNDCYLDLPNVFTPNGDGSNDYFFPRQYLSKGLTSFKMDIYNRWGQMVFETTNLEGSGWDGRFNNTDQPEGVYVYIIDATFKDGQKEHHQGNVTLLR